MIAWKHIAVTWFSLGTIFGAILAFASCSQDSEPVQEQPVTVHYAGWRDQ